MAGSRQVAQAAGFIMLTMVISRLLGYLRDLVIYANFGQSRITDAYNAAFSIPDFLYMLLVGGALSSAFIPVFSGYLAKDQAEQAWEVASIVFNWLMILLAISIGVGWLFTPQLIYLLVPGFSPESIGLTVKMTRIMFGQMALMALSGIATGILHSYKQFNPPAVGSILYNLGIIVWGYLLSRQYGIMGFAIGVVIGALLHLLVQLPAVGKVKPQYRFSLDIHHPGVQQLIKLFIPVLIGLSVMQINLLISQNMASGFDGGLVTALRTGHRLMQLPVGIFAIAISVAFFPTLAEHAAKGDLKTLSHVTAVGLRFIIFLALPATAGMVVLRVPLVRLLLEVGEFTARHTEATAYALLFYSLGICAYAAIQLLTRAFYALQDTVTPVAVGMCTIGINLVGNLALITPLGHGGLALAYSLAGIFNGLVLFWVLQARLKENNLDIISTLFKSLAASLVMAGVIYGVAWGGEVWFDVATKMGQLLQVSLAAVSGIIVYGGLAFALKMEEADLILRLWRSRRGKELNFS